MLVDLDGTLYQGDSFVDFMLVAKGYFLCAIASCVFSLWILASFMGLVNKGKVKKKIVTFLFKGNSQQEIKMTTQKFMKSHFHKNKRAWLYNFLKNFKGKKAIVSASLDWWVSAIALQLNADYLCTNTLFDHQKSPCFTGHFSTLNCNHEEKVRRIQKTYDLKKYDEILAIGNSKGDIPMLNISSKGFMINRQGRLKPFTKKNYLN